MYIWFGKEIHFRDCPVWLRKKPCDDQDNISLQRTYMPLTFLLENDDDDIKQGFPQIIRHI